MKAGLYSRYSTEEQDKDSTADQLRVGRAHCAKLGGVVVAEFIDEALSGCAMGNRPELNRMLDDAYAGRIDTIIVMELLRLARGSDLPKLIDRLRFRNVRVIGVQDAFDSNLQNADMQAGLSAIVGKQFIEMIRMRVRSALEMRALNKRPTGGKSYGYGKDLLPTEPEASIVREIFTRHANGESMKAIATDLNARGVPSPGATWDRKVRRSDGYWLVSGIHTLLHNELYIGRVVWNRREFRKDPDTGKRVCRERPESEWIRHEAPERVIVDRETWDRSRARLGTLGGGQRGPVRYLLSGLLVCGVCGSKMNIYGGKDRRYVCGTFHGGGAHACSNRLSVPRLLVEERVLEPILANLASPTLIEEMVEKIRDHCRKAQIAPLHSEEVEKVGAEIADLRRLVAEGVLTAQRAAPAIVAAENERNALRKALGRETGKGQVYTSDTLRSIYTEMVDELVGVLKGNNVAFARQKLAHLLGEIRLVPNGDHLVAYFERGRSVAAMLRSGTTGQVARVVAGVGFESTYPPVALLKVKEQH